MSQEFNMHRDYWDFCDDYSRHEDFYNMPTPPASPSNQMNCELTPTVESSRNSPEKQTMVSNDYLRNAEECWNYLHQRRIEELLRTEEIKKQRMDVEEKTVSDSHK